MADDAEAQMEATNEAATVEDGAQSESRAPSAKSAAGVCILLILR